MARWLQARGRLSQFETLKTLPRRLLKVGSRIDVIVTRPCDRAVENQVRHPLSECVRSLGRHDFVALAGNDRDGHVKLLKC